MDDDWDDLDLDDWSETEEGDASDTWDDFDDETESWDSDEDEEEDEGEDIDDVDEVDEWDHEHDTVGARSRPTASAPAQEARPAMSAMEFGVGAAVAGWLLDQQAGRIVEGLRQATLPPAASAPAWRQLPHPVPAPGATPLRRGAPVTVDGLVALVGERLAAGQELALEATLNGPGPASHPRATMFTVIVTNLVADRRVWVLLPEQPGGFSTALLQPVFADPGPAGVACCFVDSGEAAAAVLAWGLQRYQLTSERFRWTGGF